MKYQSLSQIVSFMVNSCNGLLDVFDYIECLRFFEYNKSIEDWQINIILHDFKIKYNVARTC